ncbi:MAG TPA: sensor histidine kinase [Lapillicoccus sp.]|nr:sensor histidine kinase [Lapillicoccus sp.]
MTSLTGWPDGLPAATAKATSLRDALIGIGVLLMTLNVFEVAVPSATTSLLGSLVDAAVVTTYTVTGLVAWYRRPHNATGRLMVVTALAAWAASMQDDDIAVFHVVGSVVSALPLALLLHLLLGFPSGRLAGRAARVTVTAGYLVAVVPQVLKLLAPEMYTVIWNAQAGLGLVTLAATFVLASRRLAAMPGVVRRQLLPFIGYGCVAIAVIAVTVIVIHVAPGTSADYIANIIQLLVICGLPLAFLVGLTAGAFGRAGEVEEVARGISAASVEPALLDDLMVRALGDSSARVLWATGGQRDRFVDSAGTPLETPDQGGWWPIGMPAAPAGGLAYDRDLVADADLVATVAAPLELAMDNRRLVVELRSALQRLQEAADEVRTSRRRIVTAADTERRRIAQDLHDGAQQRVVLVGLEVHRLSRLAGDPDGLRSGVRRVAGLCESLLDDLRNLVHGIMPGKLRDQGLVAAVHELADQLPVPVRVEVPQDLGRLDTEVESTAYFVVAEALTNAVKHAAASEVVVTLGQADGHLLVDVSDDGRGTADARWGFGLRSLQDRVEALDGTLTVEPGPAGGTRVSAVVSG